MGTAEPVERLRGAVGEIIDLERMAGLPGWDQQAMMPPGGAGSRARQRATIALIAHERFISDEMGVLLDEADAATRDDEYASFGRSLVRVTRPSYEKERRVPFEENQPPQIQIKRLI